MCQYKVGLTHASILAISVSVAVCGCQAAQPPEPPSKELSRIEPCASVNVDALIPKTVLTLYSLESAPGGVYVYVYVIATAPNIDAEKYAGLIGELSRSAEIGEVLQIRKVNGDPIALLPRTFERDTIGTMYGPWLPRVYRISNECALTAIELRCSPAITSGDYEFRFCPTWRMWDVAAPLNWTWQSVRVEPSALGGNPSQ